MGHAADPAGKALALSVIAALTLVGAAVAQEAPCVDPLEAGARAGTSDFVQTRRLAGVAAPLVSRGTAEVSAEKIEWRVTDPIAILTTITPDGVTQSVEGGPAEPLGPQGSSSIAAGAGLFDLLTGDFAAVADQYDVERLAGDEASWALRLTPRGEGIASVVSEILVRGCAAIEDVTVRQVNADVLEVVLTPHAAGG